MLNKQEIHVMRQNAKIHKEIFDEIKKILKDWTTAVEVDKLCGDIAKKHNVLCGFKWVYWFPNNICISVNDVVVHGRCLPDIVFKNWDLVTFDLWIKDKKYWINTDAALSKVTSVITSSYVICLINNKIYIFNEEGYFLKKSDFNPEAARMIEANKKALYAWIAQAKAWNTTWDIWAAIQKVVEEKYWYKIIKELTWHAVWKKLHEKRSIL